MFKNKKIYLDGGMGSLLLSKGLSGPSELHNINNPNINMSIAYGYAVYDAEHDEDLKDTRGRADKYMYKNKMNMKEIVD